MNGCSQFPRDRLETMAAAGSEIVNCIRVLAKTDDNIVSEFLRGQGTFYEWDHYPEHDVFDPETHSQFYYHAHRPGEHGHFHTFLRPKGMPRHCKPAPLPDYRPPEDEDDALSHLVAISMDEHGLPIRLFTTNRWLSEDVWYAAEDVCAMLDRFEIDLAHPSWPVNRWLNAMFRLFRPQIEVLLHERDARIAALIEQNPEENVFEDRKHAIISSVAVSLDEQIQSVRTALEG